MLPESKREWAEREKEGGRGRKRERELRMFCCRRPSDPLQMQEKREGTDREQQQQKQSLPPHAPTPEKEEKQRNTKYIQKLYITGQLISVK